MHKSPQCRDRYGSGVQNARVKSDAVDLEARAGKLEQSRFLTVRGGMAFGGLAYLLVGGLFLVHFGATQGDDGHTVSPVLVGIGWLLVAAAACGNLVMLRRFVRFWSELRAWVRALVRRDADDTECVGLESQLKRRSTRSTAGPAGSFTMGAAFVLPFGLVLPFLALLVEVIAVADAVSGSGTRVVTAVFLGAALAATVLATGLAVFVLCGLGFAGVPLRRWRGRRAG